LSGPSFDPPPAADSFTVLTPMIPLAPAQPGQGLLAVVARDATHPAAASDGRRITGPTAPVAAALPVDLVWGPQTDNPSLPAPVSSRLQFPTQQSALSLAGSGAGASAGGGISFGGLALTAALLCLFAPAVLRRLLTSDHVWRPVAFVSPLERPPGLSPHTA